MFLLAAYRYAYQILLCSVAIQKRKTNTEYTNFVKFPSQLASLAVAIKACINFGAKLELLMRFYSISLHYVLKRSYCNNPKVVKMFMKT